MASPFEVVWRRDLHQQPSRSGLVARDGVLVVCERHRRLVRVDPLTGAPIWEVAVEDPWGTIAVGEGVCLYVSQQGTIRCLELDTGLLRWEIPEMRGVGYVVVAAGAVVVGGWRGYRPLQAYHLEDGHHLWTRETLSGTASESGVLWPLPVFDGVLLTARMSHDLWLVEPATGAIRDRWMLPDPVRGGDHEPALEVDADGLVVFGTGASGVAALVGESVEVLWQHSAPLPVSAPQSHEGRLLVPARSGIFVVRPDTGEVRFVGLPEGPAPSLIPAPWGMTVADRSGLVLQVLSDGSEQARQVVSRRVVALASATDGLLHLATKGELVCLRLNSPVLGSSRA